MAANGPANHAASGSAETTGTPPPDYLTISMRLLDHAKVHGFHFCRTKPTVDAPLVGIRYRKNWTEVVRIDGWRADCSAWKQPNRLVLARPPAKAEDHVSGSALNVLDRVVSW